MVFKTSSWIKINECYKEEFLNVLSYKLVDFANAEKIGEIFYIKTYKEIEAKHIYKTHNKKSITKMNVNVETFFTLFLFTFEFNFKNKTKQCNTGQLFDHIDTAVVNVN